MVNKKSVQPTVDKFETFGNIIRDEVPKLDILQYYPYGPKNIWEYWCTGKIDLRKAHEERFNKLRTEEEYIIRILKEINESMNYLIPYKEDSYFDKQRIEAFALSRLFNNGIMDWTKTPLVGLSEKETKKLYAYHEDRSDKLYCEGKYSKKKEKINKELIKINIKHKMLNRKTYGIYEVKYLPLMNIKNQPLYTKAQLAAISTMVMCYFENLC